VRGPGATAFLDWFTCNKLPKVGRINLTYALTAHGTTRTEYTIVRLAEDDYYLVSAGAWTAYDADFLRKAAEDKRGRVRLDRDPGRDHAMGRLRHRRAEIARCAERDGRDADPATALSNKRFPWLSMREIELGMCPVRAIRVAYTGELGWELHHPIEMQNYLWDQLMAAGEKHGMKLVGARAQNWLRQEKSTAPSAPSWAATPRRSRPGSTASWTSTRTSTARPRWSRRASASKCVTLLIDGPEDADPWGREALYDGDTKVGRLTSGGYSVAFGKPSAWAMSRPTWRSRARS
jgi:dimethylglycine dehydrogenase